MTRFTEILCPVDRSDTSRHALDHAVAVARWYDARLTVLQVAWTGVPPMAMPAVAGAGFMPVLTAQDREASLSDLQQFIGEVPGVRVEAAFREGAVVPEIMDEAHARRADLIVMGTHGLGGFERFLLGSVTEKVIRKAACPVMTVPPRATAPARTTPPFQKVLCPVDFSPSSVHAVTHALSLAQQAGGALWLLHVLDWDVSHPVAPGYGMEMAAHRRKAEDDAKRELGRLVPADARDWCNITEMAVIGRAHEEIVRMVDENHVDLIVMGVHGRPGLTGVFLGSTTNQVVRHASCPVLSVR
jgi:nucleotide-binding universal stress UspA family protein